MRSFRASCCLSAIILLTATSCKEHGPVNDDTNVLTLLGIKPTAESVDYVQNKTQFQLHTLMTEQRHPKTYDLSDAIGKNTENGLAELIAVDGDIETRFVTLANAPGDINQAVASVVQALAERKKIYIYGCGATGRLAKQMESTFWRPFWRKVRAQSAVWSKLKGELSNTIDDDLIGEMTGGDRALISSLEGFEDLLLIGRLQLQDRGVNKGDVVIAVTEGGETSSVIGTILAAHEQWRSDPDYEASRSRQQLYFVYNNPDERLRPFTRSQRVLDEPGITKINLTTGPQAITGSTRMQATTSETFVVAMILEVAVQQVLSKHLNEKEMRQIGFAGEIDMSEQLKEFSSILAATRKAVPVLARLTDAEANAYDKGHFSTYFAQDGLITVFIDSTERSPTFRLYPLDTVKEPARKSWIQVRAPAATIEEAWRVFLGRPFRGLAVDFYEGPFAKDIDDPYLRRAALASLKNAGDEQQSLYDFSFASLKSEERGPKPGDIGVMVALTPEEAELSKPDSYFRQFLQLFGEAGADVALLLVSDKTDAEIEEIEKALRAAFSGKPEQLLLVPVQVQADGDPFAVRQQIAAKMLLNAHSTAVMAKLGRVVGNTMTNVSPSNLKLIGRATFFIQSHVNDQLQKAAWQQNHGPRDLLTYAEANAVLFDSIAYLRDRRQDAGQTAEVAFSIVRLLETLRDKKAIERQSTLDIIKTMDLGSYLAQYK